ncbi:biotin/lipoyl-containing protein, partial [uncultured Bifidobacterium sp.]|uniref:biotin/lipoyl-containing protein n=1 Tax=uncultured Bifidobacterium sp. TaxID=165187 RepID=UPI0028DC9CB1
PDGTMSFMEVNTRIQVEHGVTEETTGVDLVEAQLAIAEGASVGDVHPHPHGHAMEFRINAEDPSKGFVPFPGTIGSLRVPSGPGIRFDTGVEAGSVVSGRFDSLLAKLVVWAPDRASCIRRARRALAELSIGGVPTVVPFDAAVLEDDDFCADDHLGVYTRWIEERFLPRTDSETLRGPGFVRTPDGGTLTRTWIELDGRRMSLALPASLAMAGTAVAGARDAGDGPDEKPGTIAAPLTGTVVSWLAEDGSHVDEGQTVAVLEAMKMETRVTSPASGVLHVAVKAGDLVDYGSPMGRVS